MKDQEISCRSDDGRSVRQRVTAERSFERHLGQSRIILIHGFRTSSAAAYSNYRLFRRSAAQVSVDFEKDMFGLTWPGDNSPNDPFDYFLTNVENASESARTLAQYLFELWEDRLEKQEGQHLVLVGHSLGCYVVIETLRELDRLGARFIDKVAIFLMAAAFPENCVEPNGSHTSFVQRTSHRTCFFSEADNVLRHWYKIGHHWRVSDACGLKGAPQCTVWSEGAGIDMTLAEFQHDSYWPDRGSHISYHIARACGYRQLLRPELIEAEIAEHNGIPPRPPLSDRGLP